MTKFKRIPIPELTRKAFIWAEQDRESLALAWGAGTKEREQTSDQAKQLRDYRIKKWGRTALERAIDGSKCTSVESLRSKTKSGLK